MNFTAIFTRFLLTLLVMPTLTVAQAVNEERSAANDGKRSVIVVGNNWDGTIDIYDPETFERIKKIDAAPDRVERFQELDSTIWRWIASRFIKEVIGEGNHQMVDDMFTSNDGRYLYISRPSFADVIALDVNTGEIKWRTLVEGIRSDHSAISPDGKTFLVSASTARKVHALTRQPEKLSLSLSQAISPTRTPTQKTAPKYSMQVSAKYMSHSQPHG